MSTELIDLASEARALFEERVVPRELLGRLYTGYNPHLDNAREFLEAAEHLFPRLNCGLATVYLAFRSKGTSEIVQGTFKGETHTYLRIGELVVDITADQFPAGPSAYVGPDKYPWRPSRPINQ